MTARTTFTTPSASPRKPTVSVCTWTLES